MEINTEKLIGFLKDEIGKIKCDQSDATYNVGVLDGMVKAYTDLVAKIEGDIKNIEDSLKSPITAKPPDDS
ncbi:MAG: hypothetical protein HQK96_06975 [Nitrospirae bacterium]|nr:hypothetical protein [Nitrospirota bacterium]